jgi:hypothetical protein
MVFKHAQKLLHDEKLVNHRDMDDIPSLKVVKPAKPAWGDLPSLLQHNETVDRHPVRHSVGEFERGTYDWDKPDRRSFGPVQPFVGNSVF